MKLLKVLLISALHLGASVACFFTAWNASWLDGSNPAHLRRAAEGLFVLLANPTLSIMDTAGGAVPDGFYWVVLLANSLLWGCALSWIWTRLRRGR